MNPFTQYARWQSLAFESWSLLADSGAVIGLRMLRLAGGGERAERESQRMVSEKIAANAELTLDLLFGGLRTPEQTAQTIVRHYSSKVRANRQRLAG